MLSVANNVYVLLRVIVTILHPKNCPNTSHCFELPVIGINLLLVYLCDYYQLKRGYLQTQSKFFWPSSQRHPEFGFILFHIIMFMILIIRIGTGNICVCDIFVRFGFL